MKYLSSLVIFTCLTLQFGFSQVKKQYVDEQSSSTTVVVKEDNVSDFDILNSQFDINSIGIGQVIKIKTEKTPPSEDTAVAQAEVPLAEVASTQNVAQPQLVKEATQPARKVAALPKARKRNKPTEIYYKGVGKSSNKKLKRKRKKLKKRKRFKKRKRRRVSCPTF